MGRNRKGPYKTSKGPTYYCRLIVPPRLREVVGKTCLTRSLKTTSYNVALTRYGPTYLQLERELEALLKPKGLADLREYVERNRDPDENPAILTDLLVGLDETNPTQKQKLVYDALTTGKPIPVDWEEAMQLWIKQKNRTNSRPLAAGSIKHATSQIKKIQPYGSPHQLTKQLIWDFIEDQEELGKQPNTVASYIKNLSAITEVLVQLDHLEVNLFKSISYSVKKKSDRRSFTDDELCLIKQKHPEALLLTMMGLRIEELEYGVVDKDMFVINEVWKNDKLVFRPKTLSSYRRVPLPKNYKRLDRNQRTLRKRLRDLIPDTNVVLHSARHTFIELSRRAGCDARIIDEVCGHGSSSGSSSNRSYGEFPDAVLLRETQKVWDLIEDITN